MTGERYLFGDVIVDPVAHTLLRGGVEQQVEPKAFAVLLVLLRHAGELVERDQLLDAVWGHRHVTPGVLTRAIAQLRGALDDHPHAPRYIQTQHALGYRFIGELVPGAGGRGRANGVDGSPPPGGPRVAAGLPLLAMAEAREGRKESGGGTPRVPDPGDGGVDMGMPDGGAAAQRPGPASAPGPPGALDGGGVPHRRASDQVGGNGADGIAFPAPVPASADQGAAADEGAIAAAPQPGRGVLPDRAWRLPRGRWIAWLVMAALLAAGVAGLVLRPRSAQPAQAREASIAVLPFSSLGGDGRDRLFVEGLAVEMQDALSAVPGLKVASRGAAGSTLRADTDPRAVGEALGVATVLDVNVRRQGDRVRINARLADTASGFTLWSHSYERETADVFAVQSEIAKEVVEALLGVLPAGSLDLQRRLTPTRDVAAYEAYLHASQRLQDKARAPDARSEEAIALFRRALALDPTFVRAQAGICRAELTRFEDRRDTPSFGRAQEACMRAANMDPELREVSLALGDLHRVRGNYAEATRQYTRALDDPGLRAEGYLGLARTQGVQGRGTVALDYLERARQLRPRDPAIYSERGYQQYQDGNVAGAIASFRTAVELQPRDAGAWASLGGLYMAGGDDARASQALERSVAIRPSYGALSNLGTLRFQAGAYREAADLYRHAAELGPDDYRVWGNLGDALTAQPDPATAAEAANAYERAARMVEAYLRIQGADAQARAWLAWYRASLGQAGPARHALAEADALATERGEVALIGAQTLARLGDDAAARVRIERAAAEGIPRARMRALPSLRGLLGTQDDGRAAGNGGG